MAPTIAEAVFARFILAKEILGPLKHIPIFVTGGINKNNIKDFILAGAIGVSLGEH